MLREHTMTTAALHIIPTGGPLGAQITGADLAQPLSPEQVAQVRGALLDYGVVFFRDQHISEEDQLRFTGYFGKPVEHVRKQRPRPVPEIFIISNVEENGEPIGALGHGEVSFHSDLSYLRQPGTLSVLYAVEIPEQGGQTQWCNCTAAYSALNEAMKERLAGLRAVHRHYVEEQNPPEMVDHPIVRTHPETGRKSLYVGPHLTQYVVDMQEEEGAQLLSILYAHLDQPRFVWTHEWRVGDLVLWDNRPTMHRRLPFPAQQRRIMKRTQIFNDEVPF